MSEGIELVLANDISVDSEETLEKNRLPNYRSWHFWLPIVSLAINLANATLGAGVLGETALSVTLGVFSLSSRPSICRKRDRSPPSPLDATGSGRYHRHHHADATAMSSEDTVTSLLSSLLLSLLFSLLD